jgi:hypothetical protein
LGKTGLALGADSHEATRHSDRRPLGV